MRLWSLPISLRWKITWQHCTTAIQCDKTAEKRLPQYACSLCALCVRCSCIWWSICECIRTGIHLVYLFFTRWRHYTPFYLVKPEMQSWLHVLIIDRTVLLLSIHNVYRICIVVHLEDDYYHSFLELLRQKRKNTEVGTS